MIYDIVFKYEINNIYNYIVFIFLNKIGYYNKK